ncbi:MAG: hypothetical protein KDE07_00355 [Sphingomonadaceae bacterium]|nr:hypothetical protein [Sphingomonadaceae bacterium]
MTGSAQTEEPAKPDQTLCDGTGEKSYFEADAVNLPIHVSLCGSGDLAGPGGWIEYRQGYADQAGRMVFPDNRESSRSAFGFAELRRMGIYDAWMKFTLGGMEFTLSEAVIVATNDPAMTTHTAGLSIDPAPGDEGTEALFLELQPHSDLAQLGALSGALPECHFDLGCDANEP